VYQVVKLGPNLLARNSRAGHRVKSEREINKRKMALSPPETAAAFHRLSKGLGWFKLALPNRVQQ
jgi:hypothetical protein